jgi:uncharacterized protein
MSSPQHEPTMEEILASIRKIISEDNPEPAPAAAAAPKPTPVPEPEADEPDMEVLELTQEVAEPTPPLPEPEPVAAPEPPKVEEPAETRTDEIVFEPIARREPAADSDIFSDQTRRAMEDTFDSIPDEPEEPAPARPERAPAVSDGASVESVFERAVRESFEPVLQKYLQDNSQIVIERMKPLIREWMDENFPALLENAVRGEVERIVKARTRR